MAELTEFRKAIDAMVNEKGISQEKVLETIKQVESQMLVRNYKGFLND